MIFARKCHPTVARTLAPTDLAGANLHLWLRRKTYDIDGGVFATLSEAEVAAAKLIEADDWIEWGAVHVGGQMGPVASVVTP